MQSPTPGEPSSVVPEFLAGGGEIAQRIREYPWVETPPVETWPQNLRTCLFGCSLGQNSNVSRLIFIKDIEVVNYDKE